MMLYKKMKVYMELVEMKAKLASLLPFLLGVLYCVYNMHRIRVVNSIILILAMLLFNMSVDMLDNYCDYKNASLEHDYREKTNIIGREDLSLKSILATTIIFVSISAVLGLYLVNRSGYVLLLLGIYSFCVGIFYSAGPIPISSLPLGEFFSGTTMGFIIILITVGVNIGGFSNLNYAEVANIFVFSIPSMFAISALMLTNNLCDVVEDRINGRKTLACVIGQENSIKLLYIFYGICLFGVIVNVILRLAPITYLLVLLTTGKVFKNVKKIEDLPVKNKSFRFAVANLGMILVLQFAGFFIGVLI